MKNKKILFVLSVFGFLSGVVSDALALPYSAFDPRSFAMGGTGVASGNSGNASFFNPALLAAARQQDNFSLEFPIIGARVSDPDKLIKAADDFNSAKYMTNFSNAVDTYNLDPTNQSNRDALVASAQNLEAGLLTLSNKALQGEVDVGLVVGIPSKNLGMSLYVNGWVVGGAEATLSQTDISTIDSIISTIQSNNMVPITNPIDSFNSTLVARFALLEETGISLAREFDIAGNSVAIGVTPKYVRVQTYDYGFSGKSLDNAKIDIKDGKATSSNFNLDVGAVKNFGNGIRTGFAIKNLVPKTYTTVLGNTLKIDPQARIGVAIQNSWSTVAADLDLTENKPVEFDSKTRYLGIGAELDAWRWAQVRVGYRYNIADSKTSTASAGIGLSPFGIHFDLSVAGNSRELGIALQTGFRF